MTYDLRRLSLAGLVQRIEHTNRYAHTPDGIKFAVFHAQVHNRLLRPIMAAGQPQAPPELQQALDTLGRHVLDELRLPSSTHESQSRFRFARMPEGSELGGLGFPLTLAYAIRGGGT